MSDLRGGHVSAPQAPALYVGRVMHHRMKPKVHRFTYDVFSCLLDLDRLAEAGQASRLFSVDRFNLLSFHQRDHGEGHQDGLAASARASLADAGIEGCDARILLLAYPRVLGYVFNPLSVYYCFRPDGRLGALIYEVSNTFGGRHTYVAAVGVEADDPSDDGTVRQECEKVFYVSPFLDMSMRYKFRLGVPGEVLRLRILEEDADGPILAATFFAQRRSFTTRQLFAAFARLPLLTGKIIVAIHWEALKLWLKGVRLVPRPAAAPAPTVLPAQASRGRP